MLASQKAVETRCYTDGGYEVAIPWIDNKPPLHCNRMSAKTDSTVLKGILKEDRMLLRNIAKYCRPM